MAKHVVWARFRAHPVRDEVEVQINMDGDMTFSCWMSLEEAVSMSDRLVEAVAGLRTRRSDD